MADAEDSALEEMDEDDKLAAEWSAMAEDGDADVDEQDKLADLEPEMLACMHGQADACKYRSAQGNPADDRQRAPSVAALEPRESACDGSSARIAPLLMWWQTITEQPSAHSVAALFGCWRRRRLTMLKANTPGARLRACSRRTATPDR